MFVDIDTVYNHEQIMFPWPYFSVLIAFIHIISLNFQEVPMMQTNTFIQKNLLWSGKMVPIITKYFTKDIRLEPRSFWIPNLLHL